MCVEDDVYVQQSRDPAQTQPDADRHGIYQSTALHNVNTVMGPPEKLQPSFTQAPHKPLCSGTGSPLMYQEGPQNSACGTLPCRGIIICRTYGCQCKAAGTCSCHAMAFMIVYGGPE